MARRRWGEILPLKNVWWPERWSPRARPGPRRAPACAPFKGSGSVGRPGRRWRRAVDELQRVGIERRVSAAGSENEHAAPSTPATAPARRRCPGGRGIYRPRTGGEQDESSRCPTRRPPPSGDLREAAPRGHVEPWTGRAPTAAAAVQGRAKRRARPSTRRSSCRRLTRTRGVEARSSPGPFHREARLNGNLGQRH